MTLRHHSPPPVQMRVAPGPLLGAGAAAVAIVGLLGLLYWWGFSSAAWWLRGAVAGVWLVAVLLAVRAWRHLPAGVLRWDGQGWLWQPRLRPGEPGNEQDFVALTTLQTVFDAQFAIGLRCSIGARRYFFWLQRSANPGCWDAARRAVYSSALVTPPQVVP